MRRNIIVIALSLIIVAIAGILIYKIYLIKHSAAKAEIKKDAIHYHAGFQVYKDGVLVDFSGLKYMHDKPCDLNETPVEEEHEDEQEEKAHLHDLIGDVVHVHRSGVVWKELFINLKYPIPENSEFYLSGEKMATGLNTPIKAYDSISIFINSDPLKEQHIASRVTKEHIIETEKRSENCGS